MNSLNPLDCMCTSIMDLEAYLRFLDLQLGKNTFEVAFEVLFTVFLIRKYVDMKKFKSQADLKGNIDNRKHCICFPNILSTI